MIRHCIQYFSTPALIAALLLALMPAAGHALQVCVCPDGAVSIDTACEPQSCCDDASAGLVHAEPAPSEPASQCTNLPLLPESEQSAQTAAPAAPRVNAPPMPGAARPCVDPPRALSHTAPTPPDPLRPAAHPLSALRTTVLLV